MKARRIRSGIVLGGMILLVVGLVAGCNLSGSDNFTVYLTDAPADDFDEVVVNIKQVIGMQAENEDSDDPEEGTVILEFLEDEKKIDLLTLQGVTAELGSATIPAGTYTQLRIVVWESGNYAVPTGADSSTPMTVASGTTTGVKIVIPGGIVVEEDANASITLDWDLTSADATQINPDADGYLMTPVIKVVNQLPSN